MKKAICIVLSVAMIFSLTSCFPSHELKETAIVQAIAVDMTDEGYEVTLQFYAPKGSGATTAIDTSNNNANVVVAKGKTITEAIDQATAIQGEYIFTGNNRLLIIGERFAKEGVESLFSYFDRNHLTTQNIDVLVAEGSAKEVVSVNIDQGILAAEMLEKIVENCEENGMILRCPYYMFSQNMFQYQGSSVVPVIEKTGGQEEQSEDKGTESGDASVSESIQSVDVVKIEKTAVFKDYKLADIVDKDCSQGLAFLSNTVREATIVAEDTKGRLSSINLYSCDAKLKPEFQNNQITFVLRIKSKASIDEVLLPAGEYAGLDELELFAQSAEKLIADECTRAFNRIVKEDQSNVLYLGDLIHKNNPKLWTAIQNDFPDHLEKLNFRTEVDVDITRLSIEANQAQNKNK